MTPRIARQPEDVVAVLSPHLALVTDASAVIASSPQASYTYRTHEADVAAVLARIDGSRTVRQIAFDCGVPVARAVQVVTPLLEAGDLNDIGPLLDAGSVDALLEGYLAISDAWAADVFACDFWDAVLDGRASTDMLLNWGLELFHRTRGAEVHNLVAARSCSDPVIAPVLERHHREEIGHAEIIAGGLHGCGIAPTRVLESIPLDGTRGLIDMMCRLGRVSSIGYLGCYGVFHAPHDGQSVAGIAAQFERFAALYPGLRPLFECVAAHACLDLQLGHDVIDLVQVARARWPLSRSERIWIITGAWLAASSLDRLFADITRASPVLDRLGGPRHVRHQDLP